MATQEKQQTDNDFHVFFSGIVAQEYSQTRQAVDEAAKGNKKKVYRNLTKMLQECYFVGSLKYGNNFIA